MNSQKSSHEEYGLWIVTRVMQKKYITLKENGLSFDGQKHDVTGVRFAPELKNDPEILETLRETARGYLKLYYFLEEDPALRFDSVEYTAEENDPPVTGMTLLSLFETGQLRLKENREGDWILIYDSGYTEKFPEPEKVVRRVFEDIVRFGGADPEQYALTLMTRGGFRTEDLSDDLSVTSCYEDEEWYSEWEEDTPEINLKETDEGELSVSFSDGEKTERELIVEKNMEDTLKRLSRMISDIDEGAGESGAGSSGYTLTYNDHGTVEGSRLTAAVPDGFRAETDTEDLLLILWLPNPDNPEIWEASGFALTAENAEIAGDSGAGGENLNRTANGQNLRFECVRGNVLFTVLMTHVEQGKQTEAEETVRRLLSGITIR